MTLTPKLTAGSYLALRRTAADVTIAAAGRVYAAGTSIDAIEAERLLEEAERDMVVLGEPGLRRLQAAFHFDPAVYLALTQGGPSSPSICRGCGCTWSDACPGRCAWVDETETLCTSCDDRGVFA